MLTFEEFFQKKKIDLTKLQLADFALFEEFNKHYPLMGEKSFDHTKKYLFNQLRRTYPLPEIVKPHPVLAEAISDMALQGIAAAAAQNLDANISKPKFKEDELTLLSADDLQEKDISIVVAEQEIIQSQQNSETPKPAFKPRFNSKIIIKSADDQSKEVDNKLLPIAEHPKIELPELPITPMLGLQDTEKDTVKIVSDTNEPENSDTKPVYKPRFKMKQNVAPETNDADLKKITEKEPDKDQAIQKTVYKPRFQQKNTDSNTQSDGSL